MKSEPMIPLSYASANQPPMAQPPIAQVAGGLTPEQLQQLVDARLRGKKIRRTISVAKFDAWTVAIFAGFTLLSAIFSWQGAVLGIGMGVVAYVEFKGIDRLRRLDATVIKTLALNQVGLGSLLLLYAIYSVLTSGHSMDEFKSQGPEVAQFMSGYSGMMDAATYLIYGILALVAIFGQGGTALFYLSRRKYIEEYASQTPQWIIQAQQAGLPM